MTKWITANLDCHDIKRRKEAVVDFCSRNYIDERK